MLEAVRLEAPFRAVVAVPAWRISTSAAYALIDVGKYGLTRWAPTLRFVSSLGRQHVSVLQALRLGNTFESVLERNRDDFDSLCARMREARLLQPHLTGSGSAVFGIVPKGVSIREITGRCSGREPLYEVRSMGRGLHVRMQA